MRACPSCGFANSEDATTCALCGRALAPAQRPEEPAPVVPPSVDQAQPPAPVTAPIQPPPTPSVPPHEAAPPAPYEASPHYPMPPGMPPPPPLMMPRPQLTRAQWRNRYLLGIGLGFIPVLIALVCIGIILNRSTPTILANNVGFGVIAAAVLYIAVFISMIVCLAIDRLRPIGYGLLTMVIAGPIVVTASCFGAIALASRQTG